MISIAIAFFVGLLIGLCGWIFVMAMCQAARDREEFYSPPQPAAPVERAIELFPRRASKSGTESPSDRKSAGRTPGST